MNTTTAARTVALLAALSAPALSQGLVAHFEFAETAGTAFQDISGYAQDGVWMNAPVLGQPGPAGMAVDLDPVSLQQGDLTMPPQLDLLDSDCTVAAFVNAAALGGVRRILGNDGSWAFGVVNGSLRFTTRTVRDYDLNAGLVAGQWYHLAAVFDASYDVTFYVDGVPIGTVTGTAPANPSLPLWHVGALKRDFELWDGMIDDIQVYRGALDAAQILELYQNPGESLESNIGLPYCPPVANSTGVAATITAVGSEDVALGDVTLCVSDLPAGSFVLFLTSATQGFVGNPAGSVGNLCLDPSSTAKYLGPGQVQRAGASAEVSLPLDLTQTPTPTGMTAVSPGETWNYQAWYRDVVAGTPTSNLSGGLSITFL